MARHHIQFCVQQFIRTYCIIIFIQRDRVVLYYTTDNIHDKQQKYASNTSIRSIKLTGWAGGVCRISGFCGYGHSVGFTRVFLWIWNGYKGESKSNPHGSPAITGCRRTSTTYSVVLTQYRGVTDGRTDRHFATAQKTAP